MNFGVRLCETTKIQIPNPPPITTRSNGGWGAHRPPETQTRASHQSKFLKPITAQEGGGRGGGGSGRAYSSSNMSRFWTSSIPASSTAAAAPAMPRGGEGAAASARGKGRVCARRELRRSVSAASGGGGGGVINNGWAGRAGPRGRRGGGGPTCQRALYICTSRSLSGSATCVPLPYVVFFFFLARLLSRSLKGGARSVIWAIWLSSYSSRLLYYFRE